MPVAAAAWRPSVDEVAAVIPHRVQGGTTFSATTTPTDAQVVSVIRQVQAEVATRVGPIEADLATPLDPGGTPAESPAGRVVAVGAAAYVERSFYPNDPEGKGDVLWERYDALLTALDALTVDAGDTAGGDGEAGRPVSAQAQFPASVETGRGTGTWENY